MIFMIRFILAAAFAAFFLSPDVGAKSGDFALASSASSFIMSSAARQPKPASARKAEPCKGQHCRWQR